jgi:hypothetical protein
MKDVHRKSAAVFLIVLFIEEAFVIQDLDGSLDGIKRVNATHGENELAKER